MFLSQQIKDRFPGNLKMQCSLYYVADSLEQVMQHLCNQ